MVAADDQMVGAVVAADDRVPHRLARAGHAHRQRQQSQQDAVRVVVAVGQGFVGADPGEVIHVAGLGQADDGVQQERAVHLFGGTFGQFLVDAVQRVAGLERHHIGMAELRQPGAGLRRGQAQIDEIVVFRQVQHAQPAGDVELAPAMHLGHQRMAQVQRAEGLLGDLVEVPGVDLLDRHHRQQFVLVVAQGDVGVEGDLRAGGHRQGDGDREQRAVGQAHGVQHGLVIGLSHEAIQRREGADGQHLQVARRAVGDLDRRQLAGVGLEFFLLVEWHEKIDQLAAVGRNQRCGRNHFLVFSLAVG